jgi:hypothetical protein
MPRLVLIGLAGLLLVANTGCLFVAAGAAAAGGAAAGYAYFSAPVYQEFPLAVPDAAALTRASLADLQLPLVKEEQTPDGIKIESLTGDKKTILITLSARPQKLPSDGVVTRISVRVATFGDEMVSGRILDTIQIHAPVRPTAAPQVQSHTPIQPVVAQTPEPPPAAVAVAGPTSAVPQPIR